MTLRDAVVVMARLLGSVTLRETVVMTARSAQTQADRGDSCQDAGRQLRQHTSPT
ncbi:hypothetical protein GIS00_24660 [Nakamurella sp. YIM 132087]|uniref:Uncharacterized protein n=1 Tax=Nakamurella alba TaxID=2665158 RepID=A0A7K1FSK1_9ACTN|nr:hypothetical protein [Nakamurella alba]MTD17132.1 hypothetical protein [Nakamurella alba]